MVLNLLWTERNKFWKIFEKNLLILKVPCIRRTTHTYKYVLEMTNIPQYILIYIIRYTDADLYWFVHSSKIKYLTASLAFAFSDLTQVKSLWDWKNIEIWNLRL